MCPYFIYIYIYIYIAPLCSFLSGYGVYGSLMLSGTSGNFYRTTRFPILEDGALRVYVECTFVLADERNFNEFPLTEARHGTQYVS
jgi:hypothetical protein